MIRVFLTVLVMLFSLPAAANHAPAPVNSGYTHPQHLKGMKELAQVIFDIFAPPVPFQTPGPSLAVYNSHPYYSCTTNRYVSTMGSGSNSGTSPASPWDMDTAQAYAAPGGTCINVAAGTYDVNNINDGALVILNGGSNGTLTGYVTWRCSVMPFYYSGGILQGEGAGCILTAPAGNSPFSLVFPNTGVDYVIFDGFEFLGASDGSTGVCYSVGGSGGPGSGNLQNHFWLLNSDLHNCNQGGVSWNQADWLFVIHNHWHDNSQTATVSGSGLSIFAPANFTYSPTPGNPDYWHSNTTGHTYNIVLAYNVGVHNYNHFCGATDGEGIIIDSPWENTFTGAILIMGSLAYNNGGGGIQPVFWQKQGSGAGGNATVAVDVVNNTVYGNNFAYNPDGSGTARGGLESNNGSPMHWFNNISKSVTAADTTVPNVAPYNTQGCWASFTATIAGTTMTVSAVGTGNILLPGMVLSGTGVTSGTTISAANSWAGTASISGTAMTVSATTSGALAINMTVSGPNVANNTVITGGSNPNWTVSPSQAATGSQSMNATTFGVGGYTVSPSQTVSSATTITGTFTVPFSGISPAYAIGMSGAPCNSPQNSWQTNISYPGGLISSLSAFDGICGDTYATTGANKNFDGSDPLFVSDAHCAIDDVGACTGTPNFSLQSSSPAIGAGLPFDLWQQPSGSVDIGACVHQVTSCP